MTLINFSKHIFCIVLVLVFAGCTAMKPLKKGMSPEQVSEKINPGDKILVYTHYSEKYLIVVESIDSEKVAGSGRTFRYEEIAEIQTEEIAILKSAGGAYIGLLGYVLLWAAIVM